MTNFDKIRAMTDEELTRFLSNYVDPSDLNPGFCDKKCPYSESCGNCDCEVSDEDMIRDWGNQESLK